MNVATTYCEKGKSASRPKHSWSIWSWSTCQIRLNYQIIQIYIFYIRSIAEYCSVAWHSRLTLLETNKIERIQKTCLRVILGDMYDSYEASLEVCGLDSLHDRRQDRCLKFSLKCCKYPTNSRIFPLNTNNHGYQGKRKKLTGKEWGL